MATHDAALLIADLRGRLEEEAAFLLGSQQDIDVTGVGENILCLLDGRLDGGEYAGLQKGVCHAPRRLQHVLQVVVLWVKIRELVLMRFEHPAKERRAGIVRAVDSNRRYARRSLQVAAYLESTS